MWGVTGCQLDFVLLISTLWDWSLASFPCSYLIHSKMICLYVFFRQLCPKPSEVKLNCAALLLSAKPVLENYQSFQAPLIVLVVLSLSCPCIFPALIFSWGSNTSGAKPYHETSPFPEAEWKKKKDVIEQRWKSLPEAAELLLCVVFFLLSSQVLHEESKYSSLPQCLVFHLSRGLSVSFGKTGKTAEVCEWGRAAALSSLLSLHSLSPGLSVASGGAWAVLVGILLMLNLLETGTACNNQYFLAKLGF